MTLATATIERFTTETAALTPITETPIVREARASERDNTAFSNMLYVTRTHSPDEDAVTSTVQRVRTSAMSEGWFRDRNNGGSAQRVYGSPLNPPMEDGHYYRQLGGRNILARYNDEDHRGDRHTANLCLSLIAEAGSPWPFPNDSMDMWDGVPYIEVEAPAAPPADDDAEEPVVALVDAHQFVDDATVTGPTRGLAVTELDSSRVLLRPEPVVGEMYIYWSDTGSWDNGSMAEARVVTSITDDGPMFSYLGYWTMERLSGELVPYFYTSNRTILDSTTEKGWAKLALTVPTEDDSLAATSVARLERLLTEERASFSEFNEATNTLATDNDWCSEYEDIVTKVGMEGRTKKVRDFDVEVSVDFTFTTDDVSSRIDNQVASDYDLPSFSGSSARFTGTTSITIRVEDVDGDDAARDSIDSSTIRDELENRMSGTDDIEVQDYNVRSVNEADD